MIQNPLFNRGDHVRVKHIPSGSHLGLFFLSEMEELWGKEVVVKSWCGLQSDSRDADAPYEHHYVCQTLDKKHKYYFLESWLEPLDESV